MKFNNLITIISLSFILSSCGKESHNCTDIAPNESFEFQEGDVFCLDDTYEITIAEVIDQRCPCNVVCVWEGEFIIKFDILKDGEIKRYFFHETSTMNTDPLPFDLNFSQLIRISDDDCDNPVDLDQFRFEVSVS